MPIQIEKDEREPSRDQNPGGNRNTGGIGGKGLLALAPILFKLFGKTPVSRVGSSKKLYKAAGLNAKFKTYPDVGHGTNKEIHNDIVDFFNSQKY